MAKQTTKKKKNQEQNKCDVYFIREKNRM